MTRRALLSSGAVTGAAVAARVVTGQSAWANPPYDPSAPSTESDLALVQTGDFSLRSPSQAPATSPDVIMISIDDLNDWVGFLNNPVARTPNLDRLAAKSMIFERAYTQVAMCVPARISTLFGVTPLTSTMHGRHDKYQRHSGICGADPRRRSGSAPYETCTDTFMSKFESIVDTFYMNGYYTLGGGKVYHPGIRRGSNIPYQNWNSDIGSRPEWNDPDAAAASDGITQIQKSPSWWSYVADDDLSKTHFEYRLTSWITEQLVAEATKPRSSRKPFFATVGIFQPHAPWRIPAEFRDVYRSLEAEVAALVTSYEEANNDLQDIPKAAWDSGIIKSTKLDWMRNQSPDGSLRQEAATAYLAAVTLADAALEPLVDLILGERMTARERDLAYNGVTVPTHPYYDNHEFVPAPSIQRNTIVSVWSDHGLHLGEKQNWAKGTLWEQGTRVPFLLRDPRRKAKTPAGGRLRGGRRYRRPISLLDLYPTLCDLAGIDAPSSLEGRTLVDQLGRAARGDANPAFMTWERGNVSVRWRNWRLIRYSTGREDGYQSRSTDYYRDNAGDKTFPTSELFFELYKINKDGSESKNLALPKRYTPERYRVMTDLNNRIDQYVLGAIASSTTGASPIDDRVSPDATRLVWERSWED